MRKFWKTFAIVFLVYFVLIASYVFFYIYASAKLNNNHGHNGEFTVSKDVQYDWDYFVEPVRGETPFIREGYYDEDRSSDGIVISDGGQSVEFEEAGDATIQVTSVGIVESHTLYIKVHVEN